MRLTLTMLRRHAGLRLAPAPLTWWNPFPFTERAEERMGVREAEKAGSFIQLKRGLRQVMARQFAACLLHQLLEAYPGFFESPLQSTRTRSHVARNILDVGLMACQKFFELDFTWSPIA